MSSLKLSGSPEQEISAKSKLIDLIVKRQASGLRYSSMQQICIVHPSNASAAIELDIFWYGSTGNRRNTCADFGKQTTNQARVAVVELLD